MQSIQEAEIGEKSRSEWADLPELVMKEVLLYLKPNDRYRVSLVSSS